jgi:hypothetical protein
MTTVTGIPISQLGAATLPLVGTEMIPLVQDGVTRQAPASALGPGAGAIVWTGVVTAILGASPVNDLGTDISAASKLALTMTGDTTLTGLAGGIEGKLIMIVNRDAVDTLTIEPEDGGSTAANRFSINGSLIVPPLCGALFQYDGTISRWVKT